MKGGRIWFFSLSLGKNPVLSTYCLVRLKKSAKSTHCGAVGGGHGGHIPGLHVPLSTSHKGRLLRTAPNVVPSAATAGVRNHSFPFPANSQIRLGWGVGGDWDFPGVFPLFMWTFPGCGDKRAAVGFRLRGVQATTMQDLHHRSVKSSTLSVFKRTFLLKRWHKNSGVNPITCSPTKSWFHNSSWKLRKLSVTVNPPPRMTPLRVLQY